MATWLNLNSQYSIFLLMKQLTFFHDYTMMILVMITLIVLYIMLLVIINKHINRLLLECQMTFNYYIYYMKLTSL